MGHHRDVHTLFAGQRPSGNLRIDAIINSTGNLPAHPAIFPDGTAPVVTAPAEEALKLQRPLADKPLKIVATSEKKDAA